MNKINICLTILYITSIWHFLSSEFYFDNGRINVYRDSNDWTKSVTYIGISTAIYVFLLNIIIF